MACGDNEDLLARVLPYHALIRDDPWGEPLVVHTDSLFVTAGPERRGTGTYYTPRALTEEVVTHALEPLVYRGPADGQPRSEWELKSPAELLELKICDFAMGSGAFLVQACRWLGERLVESWDSAEVDGRPVTPDGRPPTGETSEMIVPAGSDERRVLARRLIADRCLYGVDVNPLAVEMSKLSMWLVTLAKGRPFSFFDHALKCGDSLLGIHALQQLHHFHLNSARGMQIHATLFDPRSDIERALDEALTFRQELESFTVRDSRDAHQKEILDREARRTAERVRLFGDLLVGAGLANAGQGDNAVDHAVLALAERLATSVAQASSDVNAGLRADADATLNEGKPAEAPRRLPFHWPVEFPEVFLRSDSGFDAVIGNPPFRGGKKISGTLGLDYREYLVKFLADGCKGNADLVAYFFLRAAELVRHRGQLALLATNTISQGDTREVGLDQLAHADWSIVRAWKSRPWPGDASIQIALVWLCAGNWKGDIVLDDSPVTGIVTTLDLRTRTSGTPYLLLENDRHAFQGSNLNGIGFVITEAEALRLIAESAKNRDVLAPFLNGEDLNSSPTQSASRWVINFRDWPIERAQEYPGPLAIVARTCEATPRPTGRSEEARTRELVEVRGSSLGALRVDSYVRARHCSSANQQDLNAGLRCDRYGLFPCARSICL